MTLINIVIASLSVSLISFVGVFLLALSKKQTQKFLKPLIAFASGAMLGNTFFHLLPEGVELLAPEMFATIMLCTVMVYFVLEKLLHWHHCQDEQEGHDHSNPAVGYLSLIGDVVHNFVDGLVIAAAFIISPAAGIATSISLAAHEIPQEFADFSLLIHAGFKRSKALFFNFLSALTAVAGALIGWYFSTSTEMFEAYLLPVAAGSFLYIALSDLMPELRSKTKLPQFFVNVLLVIAGIALLWAFSLFE
jgi:zinc and cadmium transporter